MVYLIRKKENVAAAKCDNILERHALPEEIAELATFLMSDASNFIVGQTICEWQVKLIIFWQIKMQ